MRGVKLGSAAAALSGAALLAAGAWAQTAKDETVLGRPLGAWVLVALWAGVPAWILATVVGDLRALAGG